MNDTYHPLKSGQAAFQLVLMDAEARSIPREDFYASLTNLALPQDVVDALHGLVDKTSSVAGRIIHVGKVVLMKIIEFVKSHPGLSAGIALGAAVACLIHWIPFLGPILGGVAITFGMVTGQMVDARRRGEPMERPNLFTAGEKLIEVALEFFKLFIEIWNAVVDA